MADSNVPPDDPAEVKGPGGLTMRELYREVRRSAERDREAALKTRNALAQKPSRWQRFVRYVWDKRSK
jgi:hypothetical protein